MGERKLKYDEVQVGDSAPAIDRASVSVIEILPGAGLPSEV